MEMNLLNGEQSDTKSAAAAACNFGRAVLRELNGNESTAADGSPSKNIGTHITPQARPPIHVNDFPISTAAAPGSANLNINSTFISAEPSLGMLKECNLDYLEADLPDSNEKVKKDKKYDIENVNLLSEQGIAKNDFEKEYDPLTPANDIDEDPLLLSDNDVYAECQTYQELLTRKSNFALDATLEMSESEAYCSALNSHNNTDADFELNNQLLDETLENEKNNSDKKQTPREHAVLQNFLPSLSVANEIEPMDVDMNDTIDLIEAANQNEDIKSFAEEKPITPPQLGNISIVSSLNKTIDINPTASNQNAASACALNFPMNTSIDGSHFPRSPNKKVAKDTFLEKSEYTERKSNQMALTKNQFAFENLGKESFALSDEKRKSFSVSQKYEEETACNARFTSKSPTNLSEEDARKRLTFSKVMSPQISAGDTIDTNVKSDIEQQDYDKSPTLVVDDNINSDALRRRTYSKSSSSDIELPEEYSNINAHRTFNKYETSDLETQELISGVEEKRLTFNKTVSPDVELFASEIDRRRTFNKSATPDLQPQEQEYNSVENMCLTFNKSATPDLGPKVFPSETDKRRNFNKSVTPDLEPQEQEFNSVVEDKRRTFNKSKTPDPEPQEQEFNSVDEDKRHTFNKSETPDLEPKAFSSETDKRCTFNKSVTPDLEPQEQKFNSVVENKRRTFNKSETPDLEPKAFSSETDKRRTFNKSATPEIITKKLNSDDDVRRSYITSDSEDNISASSQGTIVYQLNNVSESTTPKSDYEEMDVDRSSSISDNFEKSSPQKELFQTAAAVLQSPPFQTLKSPPSPPISTKLNNNFEDCLFKTPFPMTKVLLTKTIKNNPKEETTLSAKEVTKSATKDEKDELVEKNSFSKFQNNDAILFECSDEEFTNGNNLVLNPSDFDYLLSKGNDNVQVNRNSILLKFDPLLGVAVPYYQSPQQQQYLQTLIRNNPSTLSRTITIEEEESQNEINQTYLTQHTDYAKNTQKSLADGGSKTCITSELLSGDEVELNSREAVKSIKNAKMSVDVINDMNIDNDCKKSFENSNLLLDEKQNNYKMDDLEKKIKNEVLKTEDVEKKLREAEQREEALIKRITEKDKTISKMNGVIEAYEKAIAELISEKEQLTQNYEKQLAEIKADRDSNYHHLRSLETTFSDLHVKYEKSKEMTAQLKASEEKLLAEKRQNLENLRLQEQRYEKMKSHAMQQLEIANKKLDTLGKEHAMETTKLKALLKKEEISRASFNEQLQQKTRENAELVKICDELINGQGS